MHQWSNGKATQKVVVYPIPRPAWESKIDNNPASEISHEHPHNSGDEACGMTGQQDRRNASCIIQLDGQPQKRLSDKEINTLKEQFDAQLKVNSDLKKLLIASIGDDLHCKVDVLVKTKAHLTNEVSSCTNKMIEDYENIDKLTVETNLWRTKFQASCVLLNLLTSEKNRLDESFLKCQNSLKTLLDERKQLNSILLKTNNHLNAIHSTLFPLKSLRSDGSEACNTVELAESNAILVEKVYDLLHGGQHGGAGLPDPSKKLTFAEALATEVLLNGSKDMSSSSDISSIVQSSKTFMGMTFDCCRRCKGKIVNV